MTRQRKNKNTQMIEDDDISEETKDLDVEDVDLGDDQFTAGDIPERYYGNSQKEKSDARKNFERDYSDVLDYEE